MADFLINFVNNLDPNGKTGISWPKYTTSSPQLLTFLDGLTPLTITNDDYRVDGLNFLTKLAFFLFNGAPILAISRSLRTVG